MAYFAELDGSNVVLRVVVASSAKWCANNLGGTWVETNDPYTPYDQVVVGMDESDPESPAPIMGDHPLKGTVFAGPGMGHDDTFPEKFAAPWEEWDGDNDSLYQEGDLVFHGGRIWRCTTINNSFEPGVSGWHDAPESGNPVWVQPTGGHDAYAAGTIVDHAGSTWVSDIDANVWEPGVYGWSAA